MSMHNQQLDSTRILASREWNDAQQKVVESFQKSQGTLDEGWLFLAVVLIGVFVLLAAYSFFKNKRR